MTTLVITISSAIILLVAIVIAIVTIPKIIRSAQNAEAASKKMLEIVDKLGHLTEEAEREAQKMTKQKL